MCKLFAIAGTNNPANLEIFAKTILPFMTKEDKDAAGYAAFKDRLYSERWLNVNLALKHRPQKFLNTKIPEAAFVDPTYSSTGDRFGINPPSAMILHARWATCGGGITNAHPFISQDGKTALVHNGIVGTRNLDLRSSTCDSEGILNAYTDAGVSDNPDNIQQVVNRLTGAYACAVLTEDSSGHKYLDLFRNDQYPTIYGCYIQELGNMVYCTRPDMIEDAVASLSWNMEPMLYMADNSYMRIDAKTGEVLVTKEVKKEVVRRIAAKSKKKGKRKKK